MSYTKVRKGQKTEYREWTDDEIRILIEKYPVERTIDLVQELGRSKQSIDHKAQRLGLKKTAERLFANRSERRGEKSPTWKGGKTHNRKGYVVLIDYGDRIFEHRAVMEAHIGRKLTDDEVVHHINGDKTDNRIENLQLMTRGEHSTLHNIRRWRCLTT